MARVPPSSEQAPLPVPEVLPAPYQAFLTVLDRLVDALDKAVGLAPKKAIDRLKTGRGFGADTAIGYNERTRSVHDAPRVRLHGHAKAVSATAPWVEPADYGPKPDSMTAHAYMARPILLLDAFLEAQARAAEASLALHAVPHMQRDALWVHVAPRTKSGAVRKVGLAMGPTPLESKRDHADRVTGECTWSATEGARPRLLAYLRAIAAVPVPAPDAPFWVGERLWAGRTLERVVEHNRPQLSWHARYVQADTAAQAATLMEARHRLLADRDQPPPVGTPTWVVHRAEVASPLPPL